MHRTVEFLLHHGYVVLLAWVFAEQAGIPLPSVPLLLAAGALAGSHQMNLLASLLIVVFATLSADSIWYHLGRRKGIKILQFLCKISIEPDSCVRRTQGIFAKQGARSLVIAKFIPGLGAVTPPLAGIFLGLGFAFSGEIERIAARAAALGGWLAVILAAALAAYLSYKYITRRRFLRELRIARITVEELKQKLDTGEDIAIVDLRHSV